jgi:hypothetical protein
VVRIPGFVTLQSIGIGFRRAVLAAAVVMAIAAPGAGIAEAASGPAPYQWLDVDGKPLPFQDHEAIREALRSAEVISRKKIGRGVGGAEKLVLELGSTRFHAAFRTVDVTRRPPPSGGTTRPTMKYRDAAIFEVAAYELSELLGLGRVPPTVERRIGDVDGSVQIWLEGTRPEVELVEQEALKPPDEARWRRQKQVMRAFDCLIANTDRNQGNLLIDSEWNIWLIDHTRSFRRTTRLLDVDRLGSCERRLWTALNELDEETLTQRLDPYLERLEITNLLRRRLHLIRHFEQLIERNGEEAVLFDLPPPGASGQAAAAAAS